MNERGRARGWGSGWGWCAALLLAGAGAVLGAGERAGATDSKYSVIWLKNVLMLEGQANEFVTIYCYKGYPKNLLSLWQTVKIHINVRNDDFRLYTGDTPEDTYTKYTEGSYGWSVLPFQSKHPSSVKLDTFNTTCLIVLTEQYYTLELQKIHVDMWRVLVLVAGLTLFFWSRTLSANPVFFYLCGVLFGVCASFMVIVYYIGKLCPRKPFMYGIIFGGWTFGLYLFQQIWENVKYILLSYQTLIFWYTFVGGFGSFVICYRIGPPENQRSKNLVMWTLQVIGLLLVYFSSDYQEASAAIDILMLIVKYFPVSVLYWFRKKWYTRFPPRPRLLTDEEYFEEGARETQRSLNDLRKFCSSPDCAQWKIMLKLNDSQRFAKFVEGESHLNDNEIINYESYAISPRSIRRSPRNHGPGVSGSQRSVDNETINDLNIDNISSDDSSISSEDEL